MDYTNYDIEPSIEKKDQAMDPTNYEYQVTLSMYSGRPDPSWNIYSRAAKVNKIKEHLEDARSRNVIYSENQMAAKLGYRGFLIRNKDAEHPELIVGPETVEFQKALLQTMPQYLLNSCYHRQNILHQISTSKAPSKPPVSTPAPQLVQPLQSPTSRTASEVSKAPAVSEASSVPEASAIYAAMKAHAAPADSAVPASPVHAY